MYCHEDGRSSSPTAESWKWCHLPWVKCLPSTKCRHQTDSIPKPKILTLNTAQLTCSDGTCRPHGDLAQRNLVGQIFRHSLSSPAIHYTILSSTIKYYGANCYATRGIHSVHLGSIICYPDRLSPGHCQGSTFQQTMNCSIRTLVQLSSEHIQHSGHLKNLLLKNSSFNSMIWITTSSDLEWVICWLLVGLFNDVSPTELVIAQSTEEFNHYE
jgi:hypothetical protein